MDIEKIKSDFNLDDGNIITLTGLLEDGNKLKAALEVMDDPDTLDCVYLEKYERLSNFVRSELNEAELKLIGTICNDADGHQAFFELLDWSEASRANSI